MKKFKFYVQHDYEVFPSIVEVEAEHQYEALRKLANKLEDKLFIIGEIKSIELVVEQLVKQHEVKL